MRYLPLALGLILLLSSCKPMNFLSNNATTASYEWSLITSWPKGLPGLGSAPDLFAEKVFEMSQGRLRIHIYGADELYHALEVFNAVSAGKVEMGHSASFYWQDRMPAAVFFTSVPFGMTSAEMNAWLYAGGGLELWRDLYEPFNIIPYPGGNTDAQMGGWFNHELDDLNSFKGMRIRLPGLGGEVLRRLGAEPVNVPGGEIFSALQKDQIDAAEWAGAYNDLSLGLHRAAKYYYYPGWHEPSTALEFIVNRDALKELPADLQMIIAKATRLVNAEVLHEYMLNNVESLDTLANEHGVMLRQFSPEMLAKFEQLTDEVLREQALADPFYQNVLQSYQRFLSGVEKYHQLSVRSN